MLRRISNPNDGTQVFVEDACTLPDPLPPTWIRGFLQLRPDIRLRTGARLVFHGTRPEQTLVVVNSDTTHLGTVAQPDNFFNSALIALQQLVTAPAALMAAIRLDITKQHDRPFHNPQYNCGFEIVREFLYSYALLGHSAFRDLRSVNAFDTAGAFDRWHGICQGFIVVPPSVDNVALVDSTPELSSVPAFGGYASHAALWNLEGDLPLEQLGKLEARAKDLQEYAYLAIGVDALCNAFGRDYRLALLLACAATEGTLGRLVSRAVTECAEARGVSSDLDDFTRDLMMKAGASNMLQFVPLFCMEPANTPPERMIADCRKGFTARNHLMHHIEKKNRRAAQQLATLNFAKAYGDVLRYYHHMRNYLHGF